jgi:hypothetical protein
MLNILPALLCNYGCEKCLSYIGTEGSAVWIFGSRLSLTVRAVRNGTRTMGNLNLICCKVQQLYLPAHPTSQPGFGSLAPLAYFKESLHNYFSVQGLIISLAF